MLWPVMQTDTHLQALKHIIKTTNQYKLHNYRCWCWKILRQWLLNNPTRYTYPWCVIDPTRYTYPWCVIDPTRYTYPWCVIDPIEHKHWTDQRWTVNNYFTYLLSFIPFKSFTSIILQIFTYWRQWLDYMNCL